MAEQATAPPAPQVPVEAPAAAAPASTTADVTTWAKAEAAKFEAAETPATVVPDSQDKPAAADAGAPEPKAEEPEAEKLSRRQRDQARRDEIRAEVEAEFKTQLERDRTTQAQREAQERLAQTVAKTKAGDYNAGVDLANVVETQLITGPQQAQREAAIYQVSRTELLDKMAADHAQAITQLGLDADTDKVVREVNTMTEAYKLVFDAGAKTRDSEIATLKAELTSLKGKLAASGPSPLHANGSNGRGTLPAGSSMRDIAAQVAAEMGVSL